MRRAFPLLLAAFLAVLAMPAAASAALFGSDASFGSGAQPDGKFVQIGGISTDNAGRVYVADTGAGHIEGFESGGVGHTLLKTNGGGGPKEPGDGEGGPRNPN